MKLTILGSGTYQPELERHSSAYLIEINNSKICFDFGRGAIDQLLKLGIRPNEIDAVFISHFHPDHVNELLALVHITIASVPKNLLVNEKPRLKPLKIYGPKETRERIDYLRKSAFLDYFPMDWLQVFELEDGSEVSDKNWKVRAYQTEHTKETRSLCYRLTSGKEIIAYSGDSVDCPGLRKAVSDADLAVIEASWPEEVKSRSHLTGKRTGRIAQENKVKKLILTHASPYYLKNFNPKKDAQKYFKGEIIIAKDLLSFDI